MKTIAEIKQKLWEANEAGTLINSKHDPDTGIISLGCSVISHLVRDNIYKFIDVGIHTILKYTNIQHPNSPYLVVVPNPEFYVAASGMTSYPQIVVFDRIVVVGSSGGVLHAFGEHSNKIHVKYVNNNLKNKRELK